LKTHVTDRSQFSSASVSKYGSVNEYSELSVSFWFRMDHLKPVEYYGRVLSNVVSIVIIIIVVVVYVYGLF